MASARSDSVVATRFAAEAGMMGRLNHDQGQLFYSFSLEEAVPDDHLVRKVAAVLDLSWVRVELAPYYSSTGRPSIDPELMIRMLIIGYVFAIRSERALCRDVQVNFAYRWFCGLSIEDKVPDHSAFSRARNDRFRDSGIFRSVFERVVNACIRAGLVGGESFAVDSSLIVADANKQRSIPGSEWSKELAAQAASRAVKEYLATLDDAAFGAASSVTPKFVSPSDPAAQWTGAMRGPALFAYANNYLIDVKFGVIMGRLNHDQGQLFYSFSLEEAVPDDHLVREIAAVLDLAWVRVELAPYYSSTGRPSIDPELMIRMLIIGYVFAIRSERAFCRDVQVNFAYRWFCGLSIEDKA